jgi:hypothetical protein
MNHQAKLAPWIVLWWQGVGSSQCRSSSLALLDLFERACSSQLPRHYRREVGSERLELLGRLRHIQKA